MRCRNWKLIAQNEAADTRNIARIRCKQWSCDYCATRLALSWRVHLQREIARLSAEGGLRWSFATITAPAWAHREQETIAVLRKHLDALQKRLKRAWGAFEYVRVFEKHKSGEYHAHIVLSVYPPDTDNPDAWGTRKNKHGKDVLFYKGDYYKQLKQMSEAVGLGYIADIQPIEAGENDFALVTAYITKYCTKQAQDFDAPKGLRRVQTSRGFAALNTHETGDGTWVARGAYTYEEFLAVEGQGIEIYDLNRKHVVTIDDFTSLVYPTKGE